MKKYLLEFITLFISLTAAFYVENFRQALEDKDDLKRYLIGLQDDLRTDSIRLVRDSKDLAFRISQSDSLLLLIDSHANDSRKLLSLLANALYSNTYLGVGIDNRTNYQALINSGQLKLLENTDFRKKIKNYYRLQEMVRGYVDEYKFFRTNEVYPYLNSLIKDDDLIWTDGRAIVKEIIRTKPIVFGSEVLRNFIVRNRQFLHDFKLDVDGELLSENLNLVLETKKEIDK